MIQIGLALLFAALAPSTQAPVDIAGPSTAIEIPFEMSPRGHIMVDVAIDGRAPVRFALDTGAGITVVNRTRLDALGLEEGSEREEAQRAHEVVSLGRSDVGSLWLGGTDMGAMSVGVMDLTDVEADQMVLYGVLGFDVLGRYDVAIDFEGGTVNLYPHATDLASCAVCAGEVSTDFTLAMGSHIQFEVAISGQTIQAIFDTGSGRTGMNRLASDAIGVELPETMPGGHAPGLNVGEIGMGEGVLARSTPVGVIDLPAFDALGVGDGPAILIGTGTLAGRRIGISYGLKRISVE